MVLARPYRVEAELFGQYRLFEEIAVDLVHRLRAARQLANSHADDELHSASPIAPIRVRHGSLMSPPHRTEQGRRATRSAGTTTILAAGVRSPGRSLRQRLGTP